MYKKNFNNDDFETHKLEITLVHNKGKWDYKSMPKVSMWDSTAKKKYDPIDFSQWLESSHISNMIDKGANLKIATYDYDETPNNKYDNGNRRKVVFYFSMLKNRPPKPVDGFKSISQAMPQYREMPMTEAQPASPEYAKSVQKMEDMDDDLPPF